MKHGIRFSLILFLTGFLFSCGTSEPHEDVKNSEKKYSPFQLKEDFKIFRTTLEEAHPALYLFNTKDSMDYYFDAAFKKLDHEMTKDEFFRIISPIIASVYDEHTRLDFSYSYDSLQKLMPVKIRWVNGTPYIYKNLLERPDIIPGSEVVSINGKEPNDIYSEMKTVYNNGTTDPSLWYDVYSLHFDYLYASFFEQPDSFHIAAINPTTKKQYMIDCPSVSFSDTIHMLPVYMMAEEYCRKDSCYRFYIDRENNFATMTISSLAGDVLEAEDGAFFRELDADFSKMEKEKISNLIIDLRYNFGGDPTYGAVLVNHISDKSFHLFDTITANLQQVPTYAQHIDITEAYYPDWPQMLEIIKNIPDTASTNNFYSNFRDTLFLPREKLYKGKIYVLINSDIHSAAAVTAALLDSYADVTFIGAPISGPYNSGNALETVYLTLPNTKITVDVPLFHYSYAIADKPQSFKKGIAPDISITPSISDLLVHKNAVLDTTIAIIKGQKPL
ncbi:MAG: S41 family peptidase [Bacteroidota bacterium]|nr:S41 family peptidase [Bacteroidota bacterium]